MGGNFHKESFPNSFVSVQQIMFKYKFSLAGILGKLVSLQINIHSRADKTDQVLRFIIAALEAGFEYPLKWACKVVEKRKVLDFKVPIDAFYMLILFTICSV